jgi:hypothetical protein
MTSNVVRSGWFDAATWRELTNWEAYELAQRLNSTLAGVSVDRVVPRHVVVDVFGPYLVTLPDGRTVRGPAGWCCEGCGSLWPT